MYKPRIILSHPTGNANVRAALTGLSKSEMLYQFYTSIAVYPNTWLDKIAKLPFLAEINRRKFDRTIESCTTMYPWFEAGRLLSSKLHLNYFLKHESGVFSTDAVYRKLDQKVASSLSALSANINCIYCYEDGALASFKTAKNRGISCLYDLPIGYWRAARKLLEAEKEKWPEWASTLTGFKDSMEKLYRKDEELQLADEIFVASSFTAKTLEEYSGKLAPIHVIPYGFPPPFRGRDYTGLAARKKVKILFVGSLSQRKGIADLFAAIMPFREFIDLTIVGNKVTEVCPALDKELAKHTWIPSLSHNDILKLMREQDLFIFPSLFEGFGLVITEAMSQGTPVITTERTAGPDIIEHEGNGWIINAGDTDNLQKLLERILNNSKILKIVGIEANKKATSRPWESYQEELATTIINSSEKAKLLHV